ncbi:MAG: metallophosphatase family protein [Deltaproteobacteria bacterium]|nr:metallophosphatase family protein [Deltaproteobacteria bacterium]
MHIVICSDIHDNIWKLDTMLHQAAGCGALIFCGDFCAPFTLSQIGEGFAGPVHVVWGNNDGDKWLLTRNAHASGNVTLHGDFAELEIGGRSIAVNHYPGIAAPLAASQVYDAVFYGHDHTPRNERIGPTLLLNPGEVMGRLGKSTFALYDTETGEGSFHEIR